MAFRFRKSIKIAPGIRLNLSKSGVSTSIGKRGATVNISKRGTRVTAGLPGTGLSASHLYKSKGSRPAQAATHYTKAEWGASLFVGGLIFGAIAYASSGGARVAFLVGCLACFVGFVLLLKRPQATSANPNIPPQPSIATDEPQATTTWQERVAAIEQARSVGSSENPSFALLTGHKPPFVDHLGNAAAARTQAHEAARAGDFDAAWAHFHEEKRHFMLHANSQRFSAEDTLSLDATVHEKLGNLLRKEKRHNDAFTHIVYWVSAQRHRPIKRHYEKFCAYYNRATSMTVNIEDAWTIIATAPTLEFDQCRSIVAEWMKPERG